MVTRVVVQRTQLVMVIERMIELMRGSHGSNQQQHYRQQPADESRFFPCCVGHGACQFVIPVRQRQATLAYFSSNNTAVSSQLLYL